MICTHPSRAQAAGVAVAVAAAATATVGSRLCDFSISSAPYGPWGPTNQKLGRRYVEGASRQDARSVAVRIRSSVTQFERQTSVRRPTGRCLPCSWPFFANISVAESTLAIVCTRTLRRSLAVTRGVSRSPLCSGCAGAGKQASKQAGKLAGWLAGRQGL